MVLTNPFTSMIKKQTNTEVVCDSYGAEYVVLNKFMHCISSDVLHCQKKKEKKQLSLSSAAPFLFFRLLATCSVSKLSYNVTPVTWHK